MTDLIAQSAEAQEWIAGVKASYDGIAFGRLEEGVAWADSTGPDGQPLVPIDSAKIVDIANGAVGLKVLLGHDPGFPLGQVIAAKQFATPGGRNFVATVHGVYGDRIASFADLGVDTEVSGTAAKELPALSAEDRIQLGFDSRDFPPGWIDDAVASAPIAVEKVATSNNAYGEGALIIVGLYIAHLVFKPFVTTMSTEAAKESIRRSAAGFGACSRSNRSWKTRSPNCSRTLMGAGYRSCSAVRIRSGCTPRTIACPERRCRP
jgi:hypothetical protein